MGPPIPSYTPSSTLSDDACPIFPFYFSPVLAAPLGTEALLLEKHCWFLGTMPTKPPIPGHWDLLGCPSLIWPYLLLAPEPDSPWHLLWWSMAWALCTRALLGIWDPNLGPVDSSLTSFRWKIPLELALTSAPTSVQMAGRRICSWLTISPHGKNNFFSNN